MSGYSASFINYLGIPFLDIKRQSPLVSNAYFRSQLQSINVRSLSYVVPFPRFCGLCCFYCSFLSPICVFSVGSIVRSFPPFVCSLFFLFLNPFSRLCILCSFYSSSLSPVCVVSVGSSVRSFPPFVFSVLSILRLFPPFVWSLLVLLFVPFPRLCVLCSFYSSSLSPVCVVSLGYIVLLFVLQLRIFPYL